MQCCWTVFGHLLKISFEEFRAIDLCGNAATWHACFWNPPRAERRSSCGILVYNRQEKSSEMKWSEINFLRGRAWLPFRTSAHIAWSYRTICPKTVGGCKFPIPVSVPSWALTETAGHACGFGWRSLFVVFVFLAIPHYMDSYLRSYVSRCYLETTPSWYYSRYYRDFVVMVEELSAMNSCSYHWFLSVIFSMSLILIMSYYRVVLQFHFARFCFRVDYGKVCRATASTKFRLSQKRWQESYAT